MPYLIHIAAGGQTVKLSTVKDVKQWLKDNNFYAEPNAELYGIDETIKDQGEIFIYETGNNSDYADGCIRRKD